MFTKKWMFSVVANVVLWEIKKHYLAIKKFKFRHLAVLKTIRYCSYAIMPSF
jgi:hypothetical protein